MKYVPHDYQAYCIQRVVEDPAVGLFLRPGLGKTVITLSAVNIQPPVPTASTSRQAASMWCGTASTGPLS